MSLNFDEVVAPLDGTALVAARSWLDGYETRRQLERKEDAAKANVWNDPKYYPQEEKEKEKEKNDD